MAQNPSTQTPAPEKVIEIEGVGRVAFPSSMTDGQINAAASKLYHQANQGKAVPQKQSWISRAVDWLPTAGGVFGGLFGGPAGAAAGGAAGEGFRDVVKHATDIVPAIKDVVANVRAGYGKETAQGFAQGATEGATEAGKEAALQAAAEGAGAVVSKSMKVAAPWLMQKALKPTATMLKEYGTTAPKLVKTLLDEGVGVTDAGLAKLQRLFEATNKEIADVVRGSTGQVEKRAVAARVLPTANKLAQQTNPTKDLKAVGDTVQEFMEHPVYSGPKLSVQDAQRLKVGTYRQVGKKYGEASSAEIETQKALARGLKEEIAAEVPEIAGLNAKDAAQMAALDAVGRRVALSGNKDPVGFAWVAQHPASFLAALFDRSPAVKSALARGFYRTAATAGRVTPQAVRIAVISLASGSQPDASQPGDVPEE